MKEFLLSWTIVTVVVLVNGQADPCAVRCNQNVKAPVCGYNGMDYKIFQNACLMLTENCGAANEWQETKMSQCYKRSVKSEKRCNFNCSTERHPICGSLGDHYQLFDNECLLREQKCRDRGLWIQHPKSHCDLMAEESKRSVEECPRICPMNYQPICATDGRTNKIFSNQCEMNVANCNENKSKMVESTIQCCMWWTRRHVRCRSDWTLKPLSECDGKDDWYFPLLNDP
ncbi:four-domain proteases inhibitor-like isoform X2 [Hermetia illucens]|uniref:four-domain proteases inhibitor-like isoform X2 n=1 Tax=Hermetia illucens TaxID=343691 RepID=UPI0018CC6309|nr:four-domain proteases inhibitor-like isoform X2 [Hermetia illucens]